MKKNKKDKIRLIKIETIRFSPEIECELPKRTDSDAMIDRNRTLKGWEISMDGSLENGMEVKPKKSNKLFFNKEGLLQLKEVLALLRVYRAKVSGRCGLHIHINAKNLSDKKVLIIIQEFIHKQRFFVKRFKINKERIENTCQLLPKENLHKITVKQINHFRNNGSSWNFNDYSSLDEKYRALNISHLAKGDYGTLEFRLYSATLNYRELKDRILFTLNFIKDCLERE